MIIITMGEPEWVKKLMAKQQEILDSQAEFKAEVKDGLTKVEVKVGTMEKKMEQLGEELKKMGQASTKMKHEITRLKSENTMLRKELDKVKVAQMTSDQYSRSSDVIFYDIPGKAKEKQDKTKDKVEKVLAAAKCSHRVVVAHRLNATKPNSAILARFEAKTYAQSVMECIRKANVTVGATGLGQDSDMTKIIAKPHLCKELEIIRKATADIKVELGWGWVKVITSKMQVELYEGKDKDGNVKSPIIMRSVADVEMFRNRMIDQGILKKERPPKHQQTPPTKDAKGRKTAENEDEVEDDSDKDEE